jgi:hypothetical protein
MNLLVNDMGFPSDAVKDALASCDTGRGFDLDTVIAMLVSASSNPATSPSVTPTVRLVHGTELDSLPIQVAPHSQPLPRIPPQDTKRSLRKKQDKSAYSAQTNLTEFVGESKSRGPNNAQRRQSKIKAYQVLGITPDRRVSTWAGWLLINEFPLSWNECYVRGLWNWMTDEFGPAMSNIIST